ncbi:hypothetical protein HID58_080152, partial [Brassica napus]
MNSTILNGITGMVHQAVAKPLFSQLLGATSPKLSRVKSFTTVSLNFSGCIKRRAGFVAQDDVLYPHITVWETLFFTALLRLPSTLTRDEKAEHVVRVIAELELTVMIGGGPLFRGISGGEKKRVSIGQEMLINPSLLLFDEPTSGLDSTTAQRIVTTIKRLASGGRTLNKLALQTEYHLILKRRLRTMVYNLVVPVHCIAPKRGQREEIQIFQQAKYFPSYRRGFSWWHTPKSHIQDRTALLFFFSVFWGLYPLYNAVFTFPQEKRMQIKERSSRMSRLSVRCSANEHQASHNVGIHYYTRVSHSRRCSEGVWCRVGDFLVITSMGLRNLWTDVFVVGEML